MEQKEFDDLMIDLAGKIKPVYEENKELKTVVAQKVRLEEKYIARIRSLEEELNTLIDADKEYGKKDREYHDADSGLRKLFQQVKYGSEKIARNLKLWEIIKRRDKKIDTMKGEIANYQSQIKVLKEEITNLKEVYEKNGKE